MSDFDREAEKEKLRKQFEKDKERRQSTERMSELLLKGATMTNKHCDTCGSPVFRQGGKEFCPACADGGQAAAAQGQEQAQAADGGAEAQQVQPQQAQQQPEPTAEERTAPEEPLLSGGEGQRRSAPAGDLAAARQSLTNTLTRLAEQAEDSDDLGRTREYLAGAKEAAEALEATKRADR